MRDLKKIDSARLRFFIIAGIVAVIVMAALQVLAMRYRELAKKKDAVIYEINNAEALIAHAATLKPAELQRELEELTHRLETPLEISTVVEELTKLGEQLEINFESVQPNTDPVVPMIKMELQGQFRSLARFFGALDNLDAALARVRTLDIQTQGPGTPLKVQLEIELYRPPQAAGAS